MSRAEREVTAGGTVSMVRALERVNTGVAFGIRRLGRCCLLAVIPGKAAQATGTRNQWAPQITPKDADEGDVYAKGSQRSVRRQDLTLW